jgi:hypothetical protein
MTFIVSVAAPSISAPVIATGTVTTNSVQITLVTPSASSVPLTGYSLSVLIPPVLIESFFVTSFPFVVSGLNPGSTYTFQAQGVENGQNSYFSPLSAAVIATTGSVASPPAQVTGLTATSVSASAINLSWNPDTGASSYTIERNGTTILTGYSSTTYSDTGLLASTAYSYNVAGVNSAGMGAFSTTASATTKPAGTIAIKSHPGHYVLCSTRASAFGINSQFQAAINAMAAVTVNANGTGGAAMKGYLGSYGAGYWFDQTGGTGPYNASTVNTSLPDADLASLATASAAKGVDFKLIMQMSWGTYQGQRAVPKVPQPVPYSSASSAYTSGVVADYMITGISGLGSDVFLETASSGEFEGFFLAFWRPADLARINGLITYFGSRYDSNPHVEMFIPWDQLADTCNAIPSDCTAAACVAAYKSIMATSRAAFPTTAIVLTNNFNGAPLSVSDLVNLTAYAATLGIGIGGPDLTCPGFIGPTYGEQIARGAGGQFGTTDYRGVVPICYQEQQGAYIAGVTPAACEAQSFNVNMQTHTVWQYNTNATNTAMNFPNVVATLQGTSPPFRTHSACPSSYPSCNTA